VSKGDRADILLHWAMAHKISELLFAAEESGCLAALARGASFDDLAQVTGWRRESLAVVLQVLSRIRLLDCRDEIYQLVPAAVRYLPLVGIERQLYDWHLAHDSLRRAVGFEQGSDPLDSLHDPAFMQQFAEAMGATARETALRIRKIVRPSGRSVFADLGGADGSVAVELASALPEATFRVLDRPTLQEAFNARLVASGVGDRVRFVPGDLRDLGLVKSVVAGADVIMLLNVAHLLPSEVIDGLLRSTREAAKRGAILVVRELFRVEEGPFGLTDFLVIDWLKYGARFRDDVSQFIERLCRAGFTAPRGRSLPDSPDTFVTATVE